MPSRGRFRATPPARSVRLARPTPTDGDRAWIPLLVLATLLAGCAKQSTTGPRTYTLSGRVRLVGALRDGAGDSTDTQSVEDADSVRVYLYQGTTLEDSTRSVAGGYRFSGLSGGSYSAATYLWGGIGDTVSITGLASNAALDTLVLQSTPTMIAFPNPFTTATAIRYPLESSSMVELVAWKPSGLQVKGLLQQLFPAGYFEYQWDGTDGASTPLPPGPYWVLFKAGSDSRARLVVKS